MKRQEVEAFTNHINSVNSHIRLTRGTPRTENYHSWIVKKNSREKWIGHKGLQKPHTQETNTYSLTLITHWKANLVSLGPYNTGKTAFHPKQRIERKGTCTHQTGPKNLWLPQLGLQQNRQKTGESNQTTTQTQRETADTTPRCTSNWATHSEVSPS